MEDRSTARIYVSTVRPRTKSGGHHQHTVTQLVECPCGCLQEELFPLDGSLPYADYDATTIAALGVSARAALGHRVVGTDGTAALPRLTASWEGHPRRLR